jgi:hypothetical protein
MILLGGATVAGGLLVVYCCVEYTNGKGRVSLRALQRFQSMPKTPRGFKSLPKGGFDTKMTRREAALIVAIKYIVGYMLILVSGIFQEQSLRNDTRQSCWRIIQIEEGRRIWL